MEKNKKLLCAIDLYCERTGHTRTTASFYAAGTGIFYRKLEAGSDITIRRYEKIMKWLKKNTPKQNKENSQ